MNKLLKYLIIDGKQVSCNFAGYNVNCKEIYEYKDINGLHSYYTRP